MAVSLTSSVAGQTKCVRAGVAYRTDDASKLHRTSDLHPAAIEQLVVTEDNSTVVYKVGHCVQSNTSRH
jgi:hypothetical protein